MLQAWVCVISYTVVTNTDINGPLGRKPPIIQPQLWRAVINEEDVLTLKTEGLTEQQIYHRNWYAKHRNRVRAFQKKYARRLRDKNNSWIGPMTRAEAEKLFDATAHLKRGIYTRSAFMQANPEKIIREWKYLFITP